MGNRLYDLGQKRPGGGGKQESTVPSNELAERQDGTPEGVYIYNCLSLPSHVFP